MDREELRKICRLETYLYAQTEYPHGAPKRMKNKELRFVLSLRHMEYYKQFSYVGRMVKSSGSYLYWRHLYLKYSRECNLSIPPYVFEPGLVISHLQNIIVSANCKVGSYCRLFQNVTIGIKLCGREKDGCPHIGEGVTICAGAFVGGPIVIADGVMIAANAVVTKTIKERNVVVGGVPARIIKDKAEWSMLNLVNDDTLV